MLFAGVIVMIPHGPQDEVMDVMHVGTAGFDRLPHLGPGDVQRHLRFIESIAEEMQRSMQEIAPLYEEVLEALSVNAQINDYLPIFVSKRVKRILHG